MSDSMEMLLEHSSEPLASSMPSGAELGNLGQRGCELKALLQARNGFFAHASALHVFPLGEGTLGHDLISWNCDRLWRHEYGDLAAGQFFFAEDLFGNQFSLFDGRIVFFEAETGEARPLADDIPGWLDRVVADSRFLTAWPTAVEWQQAHGPLPFGTRLVPKKPFVLGGEYEAGNLRVVEAVEAMQFRGCLAWQMRDIPEGAKVRLALGGAS